MRSTVLIQDFKQCGLIIFIVVYGVLILLHCDIIGCVWLIHLLLGNFHKWDYTSVPFWRGVLSGDSIP
jgi:hypothetical protein